MYSRLFSESKNMNDTNASILITAEAQKKKAEIQAMMDELYQFLSRFSAIDCDTESEYSHLISSLKDFESEMINEANINKKGDWRDPVAATAKLRETIYNAFDPECNAEQRRESIEAFQRYARNARFTTKEKVAMSHMIMSMTLLISLSTFLLNPPLGVLIASSVVVGAMAITALSLLVHSHFTINKQDDKRGLAVSESLLKLNKKRTPNFGTFFNRPDEVAQASMPSAQLAPAFKI